MEVVNIEDVPGLFNIAIIVSRDHQDITQKLLDGALQRLRELDFHSDQLTEVWVPSIVDIPLTAQRLARANRFEAIICLGAAIASEAPNPSYFARQVSQGCQQVALNEDIPVIFSVLTTDNVQDAYDRIGNKNGHMGRQAVDSAFEWISVLHQI